MSRLEWDKAGERFYETGTKNVVIYPVDEQGGYSTGYVWNGVTAVNENPSGAEATPLYADDIKYLNLYSAEEFGATIEAYMYPKQFEECDGTAEIATGIRIGQQPRKVFGAAYTTTIGNDLLSDLYGKKIHLVYGCKASPSQKNYQTVNDNPEAITFSWELSTTPVNVEGYKPTATLTIDSKETDPEALAVLEAVLYGADEYSATKKYAVGEVVEHTNKLFQCSTAITSPEEWDDSNWTELTDLAVGPRLPLPDEVKDIVG